MDENQKRGHVVAILVMIIGLLIAVLVSVLITQNLGKETKLYKETESNKENTNKKDETKIEENKKLEKIDESKGYYYIQKGNEYNTENYEDNELFASYSYPVINSKSTKATKINEEIKKMYNEKEKEFLDSLEDSKKCVDSSGIYYGTIIKENKKCARFIYSYSYEIVETNEILNIKINENRGKVNGSSDSVLTKSYFVSKTTGKVLSNSEIIKEFNYNDSNLVKAYNKYLNKLKNKHKGIFDEYKNIDDVNELTLVLIDEDNKIKLGVNGPGYGNGLIGELEFDGNILIGYDANEEDGVLKSE